jgi:hypothetical protein
MNKKSGFSLSQYKNGYLDIIEKADQKTLAIWAANCAERVLPYFEVKFPNDLRPRNALETLQKWIDTGEFKMAVIRGASLAAHSAAREVGEDNPSRSAARAAGQAVATTHVPTHSIGAAIYALQAVYRANKFSDAESAVAKEREWQQHLLLNLIENSQSLSMEDQLIAPCGMNCGVCVSYLAMKNDLKNKGFGKSYCQGCRPRGKNCAFMKKNCDLLSKGLVRFCYECADFPCRRLKNLDSRYRARYHMSMIENLEFIKAKGMNSFLEKETEKWRCQNCGKTICCHNGICFSCGLDKLRRNKKYCWE